MSALRPRRGGLPLQRGLSLVELMVGITVGLIVVAAATLLVYGQLVENRQLIVEAQVQQDLRATADIVVRELRRAGMNNRVELSIWDPSGTGDATPNPFSGDATLSPPPGSASQGLSFAYRETGVEVTGSLGFRINTANGTIERLLHGGSWQELTDRNTLEVTSFSVTRLNDRREIVPCQNPCPGGAGTHCWPRVGVRALTLAITLRSRHNPAIVRRHQATVRLRNDDLPFHDAAAPRLCPA
jgi:type IV pilus assembly protein PilW